MENIVNVPVTATTYFLFIVTSLPHLEKEAMFCPRVHTQCLGHTWTGFPFHSP